MRKNVIVTILMILSSMLIAGIQQDSALFYKPCILFRVYDPNATPKVGEYFTSMDISFSITQGNPNGSLWVIDNMMENTYLTASSFQKLRKIGSYLCPININIVNKFSTYPLPSTIEEIKNDPNISWEDHEVEEVIKLPDGNDFTTTRTVYRSNMVVVNDFWGTEEPGIGLCFLDNVGVKDLEVIMHLNNGKTKKFQQNGYRMVFILEKEIIILYNIPTSKVCHKKTCRYYDPIKSHPITLQQMVEQKKIPCKICCGDIIFPPVE